MRNPPRVLFFTLLIVVLFVQCRRIENGVLVQGWADLPAILARIVPPQFPDRDFDITAFGARGDGKSDCTEAFRKAINECSAAGGGRVVVPKGVFLTGPIHLKSNVNLHISEEAVVKFTTNSEAYAGLVYTRWEGVECLNYSPLIYAFEQENIAFEQENVACPSRVPFPVTAIFSCSKASPKRRSSSSPRILKPTP